MSDRALDLALVKDLSNHIYEKRKATAFQIESITKSALAVNDSQKIFKIIAELVELTNEGTNSAKMGAITALGSVSVALGSFAIAYFLEEIIKPIFATFKDTDARVRYYACESLYNIAKIARGELLLYFNEVFDTLCILVTDSESSVKNAADILDRLIKDIVGAKATNYVSILQEQEHEHQLITRSSEIQSNVIGTDGVAYQINEEQDTMKAFSLPKFIPTLLERMFVIDPFAKKFLLSWLELFDDIPSLELITFLPNFLDPLIRFLMNNSPADVRLETENLLNILLKEVVSIAKVKYDVKINHLSKEREKTKTQKNVKEDQNGNKDDKLIEDVNKLDFNDSSSVKSNSTTIIHHNEEKGSQLNLVNLNQGLQEVSAFQTEGEDNDEDDEFLSGQDIFIDHPKIIEILLSFLPHQEKGDFRSVDLSNEPHDIFNQIQLISLKWLQEILEISPTGFIKYLPFCISVIMQNLSNIEDKDFNLQQQYLNFNSALQNFIIRLGEGSGNPENEEFSIYGLTKELNEEFFENHLILTTDRVMKEYLHNPSELAKITSLEWLMFLYGQDSINFMKVITKGRFEISELLKPLTTVRNDVILKVLQVLSKISENNEEFFKNFIFKLIKFSQQHEPQNRGKLEFIIRKVCVTLDGEKIYRTFSEVLLRFEDLDFINSMVVTLNNILLTSLELYVFRKKLKSLDIYKVDDWTVFASLFQSWCYNAPLALSLCLLTSNYELAYLIIKNISELEVTYQLLVQLDILIQLLESPIFLKLRLQLLEPEKNPYLYKTLYGLLMILPQSSTFNTLKNRLNSTANLLITGAGSVQVTPSATAVSTSTSGASTPGGSVNISIRKKRVYEMLDKFVKVHNANEEYSINKKLRDSELSHKSSFVDKKEYFGDYDKKSKGVARANR